MMPMILKKGSVFLRSTLKIRHIVKIIPNITMIAKLKKTKMTPVHPVSFISNPFKGYYEQYTLSQVFVNYDVLKLYKIFNRKKYTNT